MEGSGPVVFSNLLTVLESVDNIGVTNDNFLFLSLALRTIQLARVNQMLELIWDTVVGNLFVNRG
jgi:hypothetical protein